MVNHSNWRVVVAQPGSREHYAIPRALYRKGMLVKLVTDWYYTPALDKRIERLLRRWGGKLARGALGRRIEALPDDLVNSWGLHYLTWWLVSRVQALRGVPHANHMITNKAFGSWVSQLKLPEHDIFCGYCYSSLEALRAEKARGLFTILIQMDAAEVHERLAQQEMEKWPQYASPVHSTPRAYFDRAKAEWDIADVIIANSEWTRSALLEQGVPSQKIAVLPMMYTPPDPSATTSIDTIPPLRVLWVATVDIAKGIQYLVEAARALEGEPVEFTVAGHIAIKSEAVAAAPGNIRWLGQVPRSEVKALYRSHHIYVLPTISDGFAITQLEALAHGLPVIITPNCARVVQDGETGFVVPPFSAEALTEAISRFVHDPGLAARMSPRCVEVANNYSLEAYASRLISIIQSRMGTAE